MAEDNVTVDRPGGRAADGRAPDAGQALRTGALVILAAAAVIAALHLGKLLVISFVLSVILFSLMSDAIAALDSPRNRFLRLPAGVATVVVSVAVVLLILLLAVLVVSQITWLVSTGISATGVMSRAAADLFGWLGPEAERAVMTAIGSIDIGRRIAGMAGQAGTILSAGILISLFVPFLFVERRWFGVKLARIAGDPARIGEVARRVMKRINRYLLVKGFISAVTGVAIYVLCRAFGIELAGFLGVVSFALNFIPSIGTLVATALTGLVGVAQLDPPAALALFALASLIQFFLGNFWDPMLLGRALRLSSFAIIVGLAFWGAIWGVAGMFLSVPLMVATMVIASEVPRLHWLAVLLSREGTPDDPVGPHSGFRP